MTDFVSVLTDIHQQRQFDLLSLYFIAARVHLNKPVVPCWFFFMKITLCNYSKLEGFIFARLSWKGNYYYHERHDFIEKGNYTEKPSKGEAPVCIIADISPTGQNKLLLHSRWFVGTLGKISLFKKMGHIHSREDMKWFKMEVLFMVCSSSPIWF